MKFSGDVSHRGRMRASDSVGPILTYAQTALRGGGPGATPQWSARDSTSSPRPDSDWVGRGVLGARQLVTPRAGDLDTEAVVDDVQRQPEVPVGDAVVSDGVRGQLRD